MATFQFFGPFIITYDQMEPNEQLLDFYLKMGQSKSNFEMKQVDNDTAYYCAFNFPAVLKTAGARAWKEKFKPMHD